MACDVPRPRWLAGMVPADVEESFTLEQKEKERGAIRAEGEPAPPPASSGEQPAPVRWKGRDSVPHAARTS